MKDNKYHFPVRYSLISTLYYANKFIANPVNFILKRLDKAGGTYSTSLGFNQNIIVTQNPAFINYVLKENHKNYHKSILTAERAAKLFGNGLIFSNGEYWLKQRRLIQPAFHREKIQGLNEIVIKVINDFFAQIPEGAAVDIYPLMHQFAFNVIIKSVFDIDLSPATMTELSEILSSLQDFLIRDINQPVHRLMYPFTRSKTKHLKKAKRVREIFGEIITNRKKETKAYADLLDMLLHSRYEDTGEQMSDDQLIDEVIIIVFAGHETTANTLAWLLYLISATPTVYNKLLSSIDKQSTLESLFDEYLKANIYEAMRIYPPAWMTDRVALADDQFEEYSYPKNTILVLFLYGLHHDKEFWKEHSIFKPERFLEDAGLVKSKNFIPFGVGPRMCIGNNFAMMEMTFFLQLFLKNFTITNTNQIPEMKPVITLRPDKVVLGISKR